MQNRWTLYVEEVYRVFVCSWDRLLHPAKGNSGQEKKRMNFIRASCYWHSWDRTIGWPPQRTACPLYCTTRPVMTALLGIQQGWIRAWAPDSRPGAPPSPARCPAGRLVRGEDAGMSQECDISRPFCEKSARHMSVDMSPFKVLTTFSLRMIRFDCS